MTTTTDRPTDFSDAFEEWNATVGDKLNRARLGDNGDHGDTGELIAPLYHRGADELGVPGLPPFTRGAYSSGYRKAHWQMVQYAGFGTAQETNERWKAIIAAGQNAVSLAFDLPSHLGLDSDDPLAVDEVGKAGTAVDSLADFEVLFDGIDIGSVPATFNTAAIAPIVVAMYHALAEKRGIDPADLRGTVTNDPLMASHRGTCVLPPHPAVKLTVDVIDFCAQQMPKFTPVNVQGVYARSVGATKAQEMGYSFSVALAYLEEAQRRGADLLKLCPRMSFFMQCDSHIFEEAAKFRAARKVWSELVLERFGIDDLNSRRLRLTAAAAPRCYTAEEPLNNLIRGAFSALGCALGGVQGMWLPGYDEAFATPTEAASVFSLRTMQILAEETGVTSTIDPMGGSYYLEHLTDRMADMMREHVAEIDAQGGAVEATDSGFMRRQMIDNDFKWMREREAGSRRIVGHNIYERPSQEEVDIETRSFRDEVREDQIALLAEVRSKRDESRVTNLLADVRGAITTDQNVMPSLVAAMREYATVGEVMNQFREVWGEWREPAV